MRTVEEEFAYIKSCEGDEMVKSLKMIIDTHNMKAAMDGGKTMDLTDKAVTLHIMQIAILRKLDEIVSWINQHDAEKDGLVGMTIKNNL